VAQPFLEAFPGFDVEPELSFSGAQMDGSGVASGADQILIRINTLAAFLLSAICRDVNFINATGWKCRSRASAR